MPEARIGKSGKSKRRRVELVASKLEQIYGVPQRKSGGDIMASLIKTVLSQATNDRNRDCAYEALRREFPSWEALADADEREIARAIHPGGLANQKSSRIKRIVKWALANFGTVDLSFICDMDLQEATRMLCSLDGVGIKTASVVLMWACGKEVFPVDTHIHRICRRLGFVAESHTPEKTHFAMQGLIPRSKAFSLHMNMLKFGRTICTARNPACARCPFNGICPYYERKLREGHKE